MSLESLLVDFRALVSSKQNDKAQTKLVELKKALLELNSLPPMSMNTLNAKQERALAQEALEYAAILSINVGDKDAFQRSITSLRPYYCDYKENGTKSVGSDITITVVGLNLLYLLVENRLADFHCELELLSEAQQTHPYVVFCTQLDQHLVVGSYDQVLASAASPPVAYYSFFLTSLLETVRLNIGECVSAAYDSLTVQAATKILMFTTTEETLSFIAECYPGWSVQGSSISLTKKAPHRSDEIPAIRLITQNIAYATELERIV